MGGRVTDAPRSTPEEPWPVRVVSQKIGAWIAKLGWVWVDGQVAQITRRPGAGTVFLTLRDPSADLSLTVTTNRDVLDAGAPDAAPRAPGSCCTPSRSSTPARGTLCLRADEIRQVGLGELLARLEKLKKLLAAEGLFDPARKRRPPFLPRRIGLITGRAQRGRAGRADQRPAPLAGRGVPGRQRGGAGAERGAADRRRAARARRRRRPIDVIILARGGGGIEDLLPFSDEALCRAVFACRTPVVCAIGHETDTPLVDFVADVRASTPTDAAKRVVPDLADEVRLIGQARSRLRPGGPRPGRPGAAPADALRSPARAGPPAVMVDAARRRGRPRCATGPGAA